MNNWEEELELIDNLGLLYPKIEGGWPEYDKTWKNGTKAVWVSVLCIDHLDQRMPQLEEFIKYYNSRNSYYFYKRYFKIK